MQVWYVEIIVRWLPFPVIPRNSFGWGIDYCGSISLQSSDKRCLTATIRSGDEARERKFPTLIHVGDWMVVWLSHAYTLPEAPCRERRRVLCASRRSGLVRLALERTSSRTKRARESPDWTHYHSVGLSARWENCPCQCRCDVCSNLSCYTCRWHQ